MTEPLLRPEEIIAELRRAFPTEHLLRPSQRPEPMRMAVGNEHLYGVVIYVYGEGIKGQYLRHMYVDRMGQRYWGIEYGWTSLYGYLEKHNAWIPLVVLGVPTRLVFQFKPQDFTNFKLEEIPIGYLECREDQLINLDRVMEGKDPVLIVDKYDILRSKPIPSELMEKVIEQTKMIEAQQRTIWEYEKIIEDYKVQTRMLQARNAKLLELLRSYESMLVKAVTEVTSIQQELIRLREELVVRVTEAENLEQARTKLMSTIDMLGDVVGKILESVSQLQKKVEALSEAMKSGEEK